MKPLKILICRQDFDFTSSNYYAGFFSNITEKYLINKKFANTKCILPGEISATQGNIVVIAYFNTISEYIDEILKNANKIKKVYEVRALKQEEINYKVNLNKANSDLKSAGIDVVSIDIEKNINTTTTYDEITEIAKQPTEYIYDDIHTLFVDVDDIKANMIKYTKEWQISEFTSYNSMMTLTDEFQMTPAMYFVLYERRFEFNSLNPDYKRKLYSQRNIFGHNIIDIASLSSFEVWENIRKEFDFDYKLIGDDKDNNNHKKIPIGKIAEALGVVAAGGYSIYKRDPTAVVKLVKKGVNTFKSNPMTQINSVASTTETVIRAITGIFGVTDSFHQNSQYDVTASASNQISDLEYEFKFNRQMIIDDIEKQEKSSALLNVYKSKLSAIGKMS